MMFLVEPVVIICLGAYLWSFPIKMWRKVRKIRKLPLVDAFILSEPFVTFEKGFRQLLPKSLLVLLPAA